MFVVSLAEVRSLRTNFISISDVSLLVSWRSSLRGSPFMRELVCNAVEPIILAPLELIAIGWLGI